MGCDIHDWVEFKNENDQWEIAGNIFTNPYYNEDGKYNFNKNKYTKHPFEERNYTFYEYIAGVRDYNNITPMFKPRGVPEDCSDEYTQEVKDWGLDGHSHSWITLQEFLDDGFKRDIYIEGILTEDQYKEFKNGKNPESYCRGTFSNDSVTVEGFEMDLILLGNKKREDKKYYVITKWKENMLDCVNEHFLKNLEIMKTLNSDYNKVRMVFFFDN